MAKIITTKGIIHFKPQSVYLGIKQIDKKIAFENLKVVAKIMDNSGLHWGPLFGTLLGIIRDNDFITWDEDIDLYVLEEDKDRFLPLLFDFVKEGFEIIRDWRCGVISIKRSGEYIDFYFPKIIGEGVRCSTGNEFMLDKHLKDTITWNFRGLDLLIPRDYDDYLRLQYGDWRTPVKYANFEMPFFKKWKMIIRLYIINHLPDFLYWPLFKNHHQQDLDKFKTKCKNRGFTVPQDLSLDKF